MNLKSVVLVLVGLTCVGGLARAQSGITFPQRVPAPVVEASHRADDFVNSIGVCTHWSYYDTPYGQFDRVSKLLGDSGIRNLRDGFHAHEVDLYKAFGIKSTVIFGPDRGAPSVQIKTIAGHSDLISMIEGPNEVDLFHSSAQYNGQGFPTGPKNYQHDLYAAVKGDPEFAQTPVISFSIALAEPEKVAPETDFDYEVMHSYAGGGMPSLSLESQNGNAIDRANRYVGPGNLIKPVVVTESGYHTALGGSGVIAGVQPGVSEKAQAKYLPRQFCEYFNHGIVRDFSYEFIDEFKDYDTDERQGTNAEACFGMIRHDLTPKPAYYAVKNLIALLREATWNPAKMAWNTPSFQPSALFYTLAGNAPHVHHLLLQKTNGDYYLVLWNEVPSFDTVQKRDIANPPAHVAVDFQTEPGYGTPIALAETYLPGESTAAAGSFKQPKTLNLDVPDEVMVVRLVPQRHALTTCAAPANVTATADNGSSVSLKWSPVPNAKGYFVSRMGVVCGRTNTLSFTDSTALPGIGYNYGVSAYTKAGGVSPETAAVSTTPQAYPDLVVSDLTWSPAAPKAGDAVLFTATIKNQGVAATPGNVIHGVAFQIDGHNVNWSDISKDSLAPGESRVLSANNGGTGTPTWLAVAGDHTVTAIVDDISRIRESDKANNTLTKNMTVRP